MPTENDTQNTGSTGETPGQEPNGQQQAPQGETPKPGEQQPQATTETRLPDDHKLVKAYRAQLEENRKNQVSATELAEARAQAANATRLQTELDKRPTTEALTQLQTRYDRLEAFLQQAGGDLGRALDSRTFTRQLFETDDKVEDIVKAWNRAHPSATSQALGGAGTGTGGGKPQQDPNELIRAAWNGSKN